MVEMVTIPFMAGLAMISCKAMQGRIVWLEVRVMIRLKVVPGTIS
ncbi:MAG: hypothetical protein V7731_10790 [Amphritea sp.]